MATRIRAFDWSTTALGPIDDWPQSLKTVVDLMLANLQPAMIGWGPGLVLLYNDAFISLLGIRHLSALGLPCHKVWSETSREFQYEAAAVMAGQSLRLTFPQQSRERPRFRDYLVQLMDACPSRGRFCWRLLWRFNRDDFAYGGAPACRQRSGARTGDRHLGMHR